MSDTKVEFASAGWIDQARIVLDDLVATNGEEGKTFSACEIFTGAPASVAESGTAAWHFLSMAKPSALAPVMSTARTLGFARTTSRPCRARGSSTRHIALGF